MKNFDPVSESIDKTLMVTFSAPWCGPCKDLAPVLAEVSKDQGIALVTVDIEQSPELVVQYGVRGVPTTMLYRDGEFLATMVGSATREKVHKFLHERAGVT